MYPVNKLVISRHFFYSFLFFLSCFACESKKNGHNNMPTIVCTTGMVADMVTNIVGSKFKVISLMGPGVDPHLYKATHGDLGKLQNAKYIIYNGLHLEGKLAEILKKLSKIKPTYAVADTINKNELISTEQGSTTYDPHVWFNVHLWSQATIKCKNWLIKQDNSSKILFTSNSKKYLDKLNKLDILVKKMIEKIPKKQRVLITTHDAFSYFGKRYDMEVKGLQGISTQAEFGIRDVSNMVDFIIERNIKAVFTESSVSSRSMKAIIENCQSKGHKVIIGGTLFSDAMGDANSAEGSYIGMVKYNVKTISKALQ